ncbi:expressed unknown protein [Seminavis robusta]|uniref:Uncharacterized protein n=1 Tax=Seminavis robusta TaxID=568900 RepID=A0A9N8HHB7_9STRA|nr:expressed unknown protein [Seminavis robusta]|eukprot:Sro440_g143430.1 n/a (144) ;mRNA; r:24292-24723
MFQRSAGCFPHFCVALDVFLTFVTILRSLLLPLLPPSKAFVPSKQEAQPKMPSTEKSALLERMKKLVAEQEAVVDVQLQKQLEKVEDAKEEDITKTSAFRRMTATRLVKRDDGRTQLVRDYGDAEETREESTGRGSSDDDQRE